MKSLRFSSWPVQLCPTTAWWTPSPPQVDVSSSSFRCGRWSARTPLPEIFPTWKLGEDKSCLKIKIKENWEQVKSCKNKSPVSNFDSLSIYKFADISCSCYRRIFKWKVLSKTSEAEKFSSYSETLGIWREALPVAPSPMITSFFVLSVSSIFLCKGNILRLQGLKVCRC